MIKLSMFFEGNAQKTNKATEQPVVPIAAYGRNFSQRCDETYKEASAILVDIEKQSSANPGFKGAATKLRAALKALENASNLFKKVVP